MITLMQPLKNQFPTRLLFAFNVLFAIFLKAVFLVETLIHLEGILLLCRSQLLN